MLKTSHTLTWLKFLCHDCLLPPTHHRNASWGCRGERRIWELGNLCFVHHWSEGLVCNYLVTSVQQHHNCLLYVDVSTSLYKQLDAATSSAFLVGFFFSRIHYFWRFSQIWADHCLCSYILNSVPHPTESGFREIRDYHFAILTRVVITCVN